MTDELVPESRAYKHLECDQETIVSGDSFSVVSNPLSDMTRTWCSPCHAFFPVSEYVQIRRRDLPMHRIGATFGKMLSQTYVENAMVKPVFGDPENHGR